MILHLLDATICCSLIIFYFKTFHLHELPKNHRHKTKKKVFAFTTLISTATFWLKDSTSGDGGVRVVGHSSAMDAPSTTFVASAIALSDKDVPCEAIALSTNHTQIGNPGGVVRYNHWIIRGGFRVSRACGVQQLEQYLVTKRQTKMQCQWYGPFQMLRRLPIGWWRKPIAKEVLIMSLVRFHHDA
jgi:hypothetical protein